MALGLGAVAALGLAPLGWAWLSVLAFATAIGLLSLAAPWRIAAWRGWAFGTGYFAVALSWIVEPFLVDIGRHGWMAPFALLLMAGGLALFWALAFGVAARLGQTRRHRVLLLIPLLTAVEMARSYLFTGFPWALIGHIWIGWPQMQAASVIGAHGLTLLTVAAAAVPALMAPARLALGALLGIAVLSLPVVQARMRVPDGPVAMADGGMTVRLVQPNAPQRQKWDPDMIPMFFERQLAYTAAAPETGGPTPDVVIWPETSIPYLLEYADPALRQVAEAAGDAQVILGLQRRERDGRWYNMLAVLSPDGEVQARYDKHHLVPFGEYMPLMSVFARMGVFGLAANETGGYSAGPGPAVLDLGAAGRILPLICYEAIFPNDIARAPERADWIVQITNDAWFGQVSGPYQHLAMAQLRAVEQGVPLVRAANTGVSAAFDPYGRALGTVPLGEAGFVDVPLAAALRPTPYARWGDSPVLAVLIVLASAALMKRKPISG